MYHSCLLGTHGLGLSAFHRCFLLNVCYLREEHSWCTKHKVTLEMGASEAICTVCTIRAPRLLSLGHMGVWQNSQSRNKDWNYRLEKGFVRLSEAVPHYTERHQSVQEYIKRSTSSCYSFGNYCKLAKHLAFVTGQLFGCPEAGAAERKDIPLRYWRRHLK